MSLKEGLRQLLYQCGALGTVHRLRNGNTLTTVAFHRVLPRQDARWSTADPRWTLSLGDFETCLDFFARHYSVIPLDQLGRHAGQGEVLPHRPLLITFDDGWADNEEYALPALAARSLPAVVFVAAGAVGQACAFWQEELFALWQAGSVPGSAWSALAERAGVPDAVLGATGRAGLDALVAALGDLPPPIRDGHLSTLDGWPRSPARPEMLDESGLRRLVASGVAIGSHGLSHEPLTSTGDPERELIESRRRLTELSGAPVWALSFPHGRFTAALAEQARGAGYTLLLSSDPHLQTLPLAGSTLGRVFLPGGLGGVGPHGIRPAQLATYLFLSPSGPDR